MTDENQFKIVTPIIPNLALSSEVYEPAEDSFLLLDALERDFETQVNDQFSPTLCLEIGPGSGVISTGLVSTRYFRENVPLIFTIDINPSACLLTQKTAETNNCNGKVENVLGDGLKACVTFRSPFDLVICNPPYVPSPPQEFESVLLPASWDGGTDGNKFITPFLKELPNLLSKHGRAYLLLSSWNEPEELMKLIYPWGLTGHLVLKRVAGRERLSVWMIRWTDEK